MTSEAISALASVLPFTRETVEGFLLLREDLETCGLLDLDEVHAVRLLYCCAAQGIKDPSELLYAIKSNQSNETSYCHSHNPVP